MDFAESYIENVLRDNFESARTLFHDLQLDIHRAHLVMLVRTGIVSPGEGRELAGGLDRISPELIATAPFDGSFEDLFYYVENLLSSFCGAETAGKLHTARSRNDIAVTLYRLRWRISVLDLAALTLELRRTLLILGDQHRETILPVHTHTQPAQPTTLAHYCMAVVETLERDFRRLASAFETLNRCPLGACALAGTGFPIDRELVARLLAFDGPTGNTYASIAGVDYLLEPAAAVQVLTTTTGKILQDLLLWSMKEFGYFRLSDGFVQPSSIMPQKRNPVALEHARALAGKSLGQAAAVFLMLHNTPFGDIVDVEDDLQPLLFNLFRDAGRSLRLLNDVLASGEFDRARLEERAGKNWITLTELADTLVREEQLSFRSAHQVAAALAGVLESHPETPLEVAFAEASLQVLERSPAFERERLNRILSPQHFVRVRSHSGGPSPETVALAAASSKRILAGDEEWHRIRLARVTGYRSTLEETVRQL